MFNIIKRNPLVSYFILTYAISWTVWSPVVASAQGWITWNVLYALYYFGSFGPLLAALTITAMTEGKVGVRNLVNRIVKWRVEPRYYAFAVLAPIALFVLAFLLNRAITGTWSDLWLLGQADYLPYLGPAGLLCLWLLTYGLGEETGWRGFALPHLQRHRSAASATLILSLLWACWHLPAFLFRDTYAELGPIGFPMFAFMMIFTTMVFTWLYNSTQGSVFIVIILHAVFNWLSVSEAGGQFAPGIMSAPIILWALYIARRYGQENAAPIARQMA